MHRILTLAALVAGLAGVLAFGQASADTVTALEAVAYIQQGGPAAAAQPARAEAHELQYEPSKRDREGDDDDEDEPRR
ncbi:hypothetical protein SSBR45G_44970 [Bradyrhizobium sp. SSBR45G]|uniref:hypothetical protein n=1 Tax=unclassified Bradyrhizobium TaxID=2631580 RepID=UPI002342ACB3|nr:MULTISPECIES: hypothetical protein [unclassified Bradyrhizobium]GLH79588.1 hypothetical protein SSBR45G_44970 [Bradyrhizobium sp. SSBR45G]GLH87017.1 hypothetical protein SSBR45R_44770 [Bradyrhizobium sp. SSBR45R]